VSKIVINTAHIGNAAKGMRQAVVPSLAKVADRLEGEYRVDPPGFGVLLSVLEVHYNDVISARLG